MGSGRVPCSSIVSHLLAMSTCHLGGEAGSHDRDRPIRTFDWLCPPNEERRTKGKIHHARTRMTRCPHATHSSRHHLNLVPRDARQKGTNAGKETSHQKRRVQHNQLTQSFGIEMLQCPYGGYLPSHGRRSFGILPRKIKDGYQSLLRASRQKFGTCQGSFGNIQLRV
jgi:hypothetical protein